MLRSVKGLKDFALRAKDGDLGKVREFYFDDNHWTVRYLVADTGGWLTGRLVLLSPYALQSADEEKQVITVDLTKKQIEESPSIASDQPVSRQYEEEYYGYYGWPAYWSGSYMWGANPNIGGVGLGIGGPGFVMGGVGAAMGGVGQPVGRVSSGVEEGQEAQTETIRLEEMWDPNLRSTDEVTSYHLEAQDGEIGHIEDFIIDDETWSIRYLVIDTKNWWPGKHVLVSPQWIDEVSWEESKVCIGLSRDTIKESPEYTPDSLNRDYETKLFRHYERQGYWIDGPAAK